MSATYLQAASTLKKIEGGYCPGGLSCGSSTSGETYRGIDRIQQPMWTGWKLIDEFKKKHGRPKTYTYFTGALGTQIDKEVEVFWTKWWNQYGFNQIKNQYMAELLYTWSAQGQNRAMRMINDIGKQFGANQINPQKITSNVADAINNNLSKAYTLARNNIIDWYKTNRPNDFKRFIDTRVNIFPIQIGNIVEPYKSTGKPMAPKKENPKSFFGWLAGFLAINSIFK